MITIKQLSIFLENKNGRINDVAKVLAKEGINMQAFSMAETADFGILRLIVSDVEKAVSALRAADFASTSAKTEEEARALVREQPETAGLARRISQEMQAHAVLSLKDLCVNGRDLQAEGIPAGPLMGKVMQSLFSAVLEDPRRNRKESLLEMAKTVYMRLSEK